jgi:hypothetical protein
MIEALAHEVKAAWSELAPHRPLPRHVHALKWDVADYPDPARAMLIFLFADGDTHPVAVAKVARIANGDARIIQEAAALQHVRRALPDELGRDVPVLVRAGAINGRAYLLTTAMDGEVEMHHTWPARRRRRASRHVGQAMEWCTRATAATQSAAVTGAQWLGADADALLGALAELGVVTEAQQKIAVRMPSLLAGTWPAGLAHGDYFPGNVLFGRHGRLGVVDWALAEQAAPFFFDALTYELSFAIHRAYAGTPLDAREHAAVHELAPFAAWRARWRDTGVDLGLGSDARLCTALHTARRDARAGEERVRAARAWVRVLELEALWRD